MRNETVWPRLFFQGEAASAYCPAAEVQEERTLLPHSSRSEHMAPWGEHMTGRLQKLLAKTWFAQRPWGPMPSYFGMNLTNGMRRIDMK